MKIFITVGNVVTLCHARNLRLVACLCLDNLRVGSRAFANSDKTAERAFSFDENDGFSVTGGDIRAKNGELTAESATLGG